MAWRHFSPGTIHLAVVDPVGSRRRPGRAANGHPGGRTMAFFDLCRASPEIIVA
jgi:hypothetical protein